ncbi:hypothetical protein TYRP_009205 [Tyrophagus putrescentiae]|nr:hypothetical protein TYRP_009205 [Tyrophagus putrescentiae]
MPYSHSFNTGDPATAAASPEFSKTSFSFVRDAVMAASVLVEEDLLLRTRSSTSSRTWFGTTSDVTEHICRLVDLSLGAFNRPVAHGVLTLVIVQQHKCFRSQMYSLAVPCATSTTAPGTLRASSASPSSVQ